MLVERYFDAADELVERLYQDPEAWRTRVPRYRKSLWATLRTFWYRTFHGKDLSLERPSRYAEEVLYPFATLAYRKFLSQEEKDRLIAFFQEAYRLFEGRSDRFDASIKETYKRILVSHDFLYRIESDPDVEHPYRVSDFELASRLSFFLWSSIPDLELLNAAYREDLHDPQVLEREVRRMLKEPKARRMGEQFALQWLELKKLKDPSFQLDPETFPSFSPTLKALMLKEVELFFNYVMLTAKTCSTCSIATTVL